MWSLSARGLKIKGLVFFVLFGGVFLINAQSAAAQCWNDYPNVGSTPQPLPGFPAKSDFSEFFCTTDVATCVDKTKSGKTKSGVAAPNTGFGCNSAPNTQCCMLPATSWPCWNNVADARRTTLEKTECMASESACTGSNLKLGAGLGCSAPNNFCCGIVKPASPAAPGGSTPPASGPLPEGGSTAEWKLGVPGGVQLVPCTKDGVCEIADLVQQAVNFARWLMGLAGALFLLVFVYGGAMYVMSFGRSDMVTKGKTALTRGAIGVVLVMGAWTIVSYVAASLGYTGVNLGGPPSGGEKGGSKGVCGTAQGTEGRQCFNINTEINKFEPGSCMQGYCSGSANRQCCTPKQGAGANAGTGKCKCSGTVKAGTLLPNLVFDGYCPDVSQYCSQCGNGVASCTIELNTTKQECDNNDFTAMAQDLGIPSSALALVTLAGTCQFTE